MGPEALDRQDIHALRDRVTIIADRDATNDTRFGGSVEVHAGGRELHAGTPYPSGHPSKPMTADQLEAKKLSALLTAMDAATAANVGARIDALFDSRVRDVGDVIRAALIPARGSGLVARAG